MAVLRELDRNAPRENRQENRRKVLVQLNIQPIKKQSKALFPALISNISTRGFGLLTAKPLEVATRFFAPLRFEDGGGWLILCEVRNCQASKSGYRIGALLVDHIDDPKGTSKPPLDWLL